ncbi:FG-GAP-like repeat-containing protein [Hymenobacter sp. BT175]|uniref:FG-GAP-like repeat-containing protein n=1 Tax=Hymenobacter translucens TaxID=2886507 RepID=UPI001D0E112C|nr:FG-GAP-like repeat-containing protein [Hymenobacter translucens]MCC2547120.1 FG-GAP-like repeat-containing protein [Hymenobacter translucens]
MKKIYLVCGLLLGFLSAHSQPTQRYCQSFDGNQVLTAAGTGTLNLGTAFTMEAWVYLRASSPYAVVLGKTYNPRANDPFQNYVLALDATGLKAELVQTTGAPGSYASATSPTNLPLNTWVHLAGTLGAGQLRLYVNGVQVATRVSPGAPMASPGVPFAVGSGATPGRQTTCCGLNGAIRQARVWSMAQPAASLQANMNLQLSGTEAGLLANWPMNESTGQVISDLTPNSHHLTRGSGTAVEAADPQPILTTNLGVFFTYSQLTLPSGAGSAEELSVIDYNADGRKDLVAARLVWPPTLPASPAPLQALRNNGNLSFTSDAPFVGTSTMVHPRDFAVADFNGDNRADLFIADHGTDVMPFPGGQNRLYLQNSGGQLVEAASNIPAIDDFSHHVAVADVDNDGDQDLYVCNIYNQQRVGPRLLLNNGAGQFTVNTSRLPARIASMTDVYMASRFADIDRDNDQDLVLGALDGSGLPNDLILLNDGAGNFVPGPALPNRYGGPTWGTVAISVFDVNNDQWPDLLLSTLNQYQTCQLQLLVNNRNGTFTDYTARIPQSWPTTNAWIKWIETADFNNDGWTDFVASTQGGQPKLFLNTGNNYFTNASAILNVGGSAASYRAQDFDNDGRADLAVLDFNGTLTIAKNLRSYAVRIDSTGVITSTTPVRPAADLVSVYPNPAAQHATIQLADVPASGRYAVLDAVGRTVHQGEIGRRRTVEVPLAGIRPGIYTVRIWFDDQVASRQLLVRP